MTFPVTSRYLGLPNLLLPDQPTTDQRRSFLPELLQLVNNSNSKKPTAKQAQHSKAKHITRSVNWINLTWQTTMLSQRLMSRLSQRAGQQLRSTPARSAVQRRFASTEGKTLKGVPDNAFNRERANVKAHAAATSGE